jgi:DNA repair exonuclease SbcCD ATPase subunit
MMRFDPTLIVRRLVVQRNDVAVYDEHFHEGVNVVRGENSSGKSTVLNCIFYGLGGDLADWSEVALLCTRVVLEVELNGKIATLSREISSSIGQPMDIFGAESRMDTLSL